MRSDQTMNSTLKYLGLLAILPLFTFGLTANYFPEIDAAKSEGSDAPGRLGPNSFGFANSRIVCGGMLCSDYPGGYDQFQMDKGKIAKFGSEAVAPETSEEEMMQESESTMMTKEMMDIEMKTEIQQSDGIGFELSVPEIIIAKKLVPINARVFDSIKDSSLSHIDWSYAVTNSDGHIIHKTTTLHGHFGIMNFKETFPESGTYTITYTTLSSGPFMLGLQVPELGQTRSVVTEDLLRFEEDPLNNFGSRTFEFTVNVSEPEQTVILEGSEPNAAYLVKLYTQPARVIAGELVTIILDVDDYNTGEDAIHVDGLISIMPQHYLQSDSGDQPDAPIPIPLHGAYHGHLGVMSTSQIFPKSGTVLLQVDLNSIPYSKPLFGQGSTEFVIQVFDSADKATVMIEKTAKENTVDILGLESPFFMPNTITVSAGETIVFDNVDANYHTVTSAKSGTIEPDGKFDSGLLNVGQSYEFSIDEQGTYDIALPADAYELPGFYKCVMCVCVCDVYSCVCVMCV